MRGSPALRAAVPPFEPQPEALAALSARLKTQFDPRGILNPGPHDGGRLMQTHFSLAQLADPKTAEAESILRRCVHCGFCLATCPTYLELGNELDSPARKNLPDQGHAGERQAGIERGRHAYRPLPVLPLLRHHLPLRRRLHAPRRSGAGAGSRRPTKRPFADRLVRALLARMLPYRAPLPAGAAAGQTGAPVRPDAEAVRHGRHAPRNHARSSRPTKLPAKTPIRSGVSFTPEGERRGRVALLNGCAQAVLDPGINIAAVRLLSRFGVEVVFARGEGCCGSLVHHMGRARQARRLARANIDAWIDEIEGEGPRRHHHHDVGMRHDDQGLRPSVSPRSRLREEGGARRGARARHHGIPRKARPAAGVERGADLIVAYHSACSLQHGQTRHDAAEGAAEASGLRGARHPGGAYLLRLGRHLQHSAAGDRRRLRDRKVRNIEAVAPDVIATGNIGCITQIASGTIVPVMHTVELLDWAYGGEQADFLRRRIGAPHRGACHSASVVAPARDPYRGKRHASGWAE